MLPAFDAGRPAEQVLDGQLVASAQERAGRLHPEVRTVSGVRPEAPERRHLAVGLLRFVATADGLPRPVWFPHRHRSGHPAWGNNRP
ncbi:hypothetical protein [Streptomyces sp. NPDC059604]|uniref:hypothetical protein n=1 Tax=Streptomyces sp. NPDC059604 TaxID=3346881 RepID=UPI003693DBA1